MRINGNFITMVGLTKDERCLINDLHAEKCWSFEGIVNFFSNR